MSTIRVRIFRYDPENDEAPHFDSFEVPHAPNMRVIDVLEYVQETLAQDIAFRWFCTVKRCGTCAVTVNGSPVLACWEPAQAEMTVEPLKNLPIIRDLVIDRGPYDDILAKLAPLLVRKEPYAGFPEPMSESDAAPGEKLRDCIQCLACYAACPVVEQKDSGFAGPAPLVALAELALDPRDGEDRAALAEEAASVFKCVSCYECERVCPAEIPIVSDAIEPLKRMAYRRGEGAGERHARAFLDVVKEYGKVNAPRLMIRTKGASVASLRTGMRMVASGKVSLMDTLLKRPAAASTAKVRKLYESSEDGE
jgi:succinate dehydrogenase/fumarate reductase iron-sulfur protein